MEGREKERRMARRGKGRKVGGGGREGETEEGKKGERKGKREREWEGKQPARDNTYHRGMLPVTYFLQLGPTFCEFHHFPIVHSIMNPSIDG